MPQSTIDNILDSLGEVGTDVKAQLRAKLQKALEDQGLVTAEAFETQKQVLLRTRQKLAVLEERLDELEAVLK
jgi:hypothetical protein